MTSCREKFQELLRELFQFDCADLDFGIYRIMNHKRDVIEKFITQDLPRAITDEVDRDALADQSQAAKGLKEVAEQITQTLGKDALDADGNLAATYYGTPLGTKYLNLKAKAAGGLGREALEASIFNHLYTFFSRYYQDGDFISKRRYSKRQRYAIPYNGEEVYLYWANNDQYYVKTAEHFHDYTFSSHGVTVHFKLQAATVEQNNVKGDKRFFLPRTPGRMATEEDFNRGPRIVKYIRIESYEDALNNIDFDDGSGQQALKFDDHMLKYMLKWETRAIETLLNVENLVARSATSFASTATAKSVRRSRTFPRRSTTCWACTFRHGESTTMTGGDTWSIAARLTIGRSWLSGARPKVGRRRSWNVIRSSWQRKS